MLPHAPSEKELLDYKQAGGKLCPERFKYTSDSNSEWLTVSELRHRTEQVPDDYTIEESRWSAEGVPK